MPYRDSKLTMLLRGALGGGAWSWAIFHVSPDEDGSSAGDRGQETLETLCRAKQMMRVRNYPAQTRGA